METEVTFLGTAAVLPGPGDDSASFLVNGTLQVDCGWSVAQRLLAVGHDPARLHTLVLTHCHHDHYLGLPGLLFHRAMTGRAGLSAGRRPPGPLTVVGPADDLSTVLELARRFLQADRFPGVWPELVPVALVPGATWETDAFRLETIRSRHPVTGFCGRLTDRATGVVVAFSGDTGPHPELPSLARNADLLIHEASLPPEVPDAAMRGDHSRAVDAARVAGAAGVGELRLIHLHGRHHAASLAAARLLFSQTFLAVPGETVRLRPREGETPPLAS